MNICTKCKHLICKEPNGIWYNYLCGAMEHPIAVNPVTGKTECYSKNDLGRTNFGGEQHPFCRDVNPDGECNLYEK